MKALLQRIRRLGASESGAAAVEFALIMPFMLALYFGSMEASVLFTADKRVNTISATVGDLIAQWDPNTVPAAIPQATLDSYFSASQGIMRPYPTTGIKQVVSLIWVASDGTTKVLWSLANGTGAVARTANVPFAPLSTTSTTDVVARGGCIIAAETTYSYKPLLGQVFTTAFNLYHINYFVPRYGATGVIQVPSPTLNSTACTTGS
ncbi:MAG TPA: TadE/TadG family type IV pilus assembly protein [Devosia sp.]|jgi:Flp pilus assembly protein TadG|nr:TadE/TadG family type IV pilus assembly protein [Devosia sp.]